MNENNQTALVYKLLKLGTKARVTRADSHMRNQNWHNRDTPYKVVDEPPSTISTRSKDLHMFPPPPLSSTLNPSQLLRLSFPSPQKNKKRAVSSLDATLKDR